MGPAVPPVRRQSVGLGHVSLEVFASVAAAGKRRAVLSHHVVTRSADSDHTSNELNSFSRSIQHKLLAFDAKSFRFRCSVASRQAAVRWGRRGHRRARSEGKGRGWVVESTHTAGDAPYQGSRLRHASPARRCRSPVVCCPARWDLEMGEDERRTCRTCMDIIPKVPVINDNRYGYSNANLPK